MSGTGSRPRRTRLALLPGAFVVCALMSGAAGPASAASPPRTPAPLTFPHRPTVATGATAADLESATVLVTYREGMAGARRAETRSRAGVTPVRALSRAQVEVVRAARGQSIDDILAALRSDPSVAVAEPDVRRVLTGDPSTEPVRAAYQWGLENAGPGCIPGYAVACTRDVDIDATAAWPTATGAGITVAVLDDGVDFGHQDLVGQAWVNPGESGDDGLGGDRATNGTDDDGNGFIDDVNGVNLCADAPTTTLHKAGVDWHGTGVASVIAAAANGLGMSGVAPDARIMAVRWLVGTTCADDDLAAAAIYYAVDEGADIINASWGGSGMTSVLAAAIAYAGAHGVLIVAAAGNGHSDELFYPAASTAPNVLSVGAIGPDGYRASFSNYGSWVDIGAPGAWVLGAFVMEPNGGPDKYAWLDGTSFAAPHVAGIAALAAQARPGLLDDAGAFRSRLIRAGWRNGRIDHGLTASGRTPDAGYSVDVTAPVPPAWVTARARTGGVISHTTASMSLSWAAATDATGIEYYRVRYRRVGASTWTTLVAATGARNATLSMAFRVAYEVEVLARDRGANTAVTLLEVIPTRYEETSTRLTFGGSWSTASSSSFSGGAARYTGTAGRWARFAVNGSSAALVVARGPTRGSANIYVDGSYRATISLHALTTSYRHVAWAIAWPVPGPHTVMVVVKGTSGHPRVDLDAVVVGR